LRNGDDEDARQQLVILDVSSDGEIETAIARFVQRGAGGLLIGGGTFLSSNRECEP
jgi:hypothetical protein